MYAYTLCRRTTKFDVVTHVGEMNVSWDQSRFPSHKSGVPALPNLGGSPALPMFDQIRHGITHREGACFRSATPNAGDNPLEINPPEKPPKL